MFLIWLRKQNPYMNSYRKCKDISTVHNDALILAIACVVMHLMLMIKFKINANIAEVGCQKQ